MSMDLSSSRILVTGASSGLGRSLAVEAARRGARVAATGRNAAELSRTADLARQAGGDALARPLDLDRLEDILAWFAALAADLGGTPDVLVNNAGQPVAGFVANTPVPTLERSFRINALAPVALAQQVLPDMLARGRGVVVNVMGSAMYRSFPGMSAYCAAKAALEAFHESLEVELAGTGVRTLYVNPGVMDTGFYAHLDAGDRLGRFRYPGSAGSPSPDGVAARILDAVASGADRVVVEGMMARVGRTLSFFAPRLLARLMASRNAALLANLPGRKEGE